MSVNPLAFLSQLIPLVLATSTQSIYPHWNSLVNLRYPTETDESLYFQNNKFIDTIKTNRPCSLVVKRQSPMLVLLLSCTITFGFCMGWSLAVWRLTGDQRFEPAQSHSFFGVLEGKYTKEGVLSFLFFGNCCCLLQTGKWEN